MNFYFMVRSFVGSVFVSLLVSLLFPSVASAELESYGFPLAASQRKPQFVVQTALVSRDAHDAPSQITRLEKHRKAQKKSIAALLRSYNSKLSQQAASQYADYILQAGEKFQQDPFVIAAMIVKESSARHDAVSRGGDYGLMQVRWRVHRRSIAQKYPQIKDAKAMLDPEYNILVGTEILARYCASADDLRGGLMRYSAGNRKLAEKIFAVLKGLQSSYQEHLTAL